MSLIAVILERSDAYKYLALGNLIPGLALGDRWRVDYLDFTSSILIDATRIRGDLFQILVENGFWRCMLAFMLDPGSRCGNLYVEQPVSHVFIAVVEIPELPAQYGSK